MKNQLVYDTFSHEILLRLEKKLGGEKSLKIRKVLKNNNVELDGIVVDDDGSQPSPTFYMQQLYLQYTNGATIDEIVDYTSSYYEQDYDSSFFEFGKMDHFEDLKDKVAFKLINREANEKFLQDIPFFHFLDLAVVFYVLVRDKQGAVGRVTVHNVHMERWGIGKKELYDAAVKNTKELLGIEILTIQEVIVDMILKAGRIVPEVPVSEELRQEFIESVRKDAVRFPIYVLTNYSRSNGAVCMLYKELEQFADQIEDDLFIIPSSIHEVLLVPAKEPVSDQDLLEILHEVNRDEVDETEYLSDKVYRYDRKTRHISY